MTNTESGVYVYPIGIKVVSVSEMNLDFKDEKLRRGHSHHHNGNPRSHNRRRLHRAEQWADRYRSLMKMDEE